MSTVPRAPAGTTVEICEELLTVKEATDVVPKLTVDAAVKLLPVMTIGDPPLKGPLFVEIAAIEGIA